MMRRSLVGILAAVLSVGPASSAARAQAAPAAAASVQYVRVDGADYAFTAPVTIKAGLTVFNLVNIGRDQHAMTVLLLPSGRTMKQFMDAFNATMKVPTWAPVLGETGTIKPGAEAFVTARLQPGRYILACLIPAADGRSHTEKGMVQMVTVK